MTSKKTGTDVAVRDQRQPRTKPGTAQDLLVYIAQASKDKDFDKDKFSILLSSRAALKAEAAKESFDQDYFELINDLRGTRITKGGVIEITKKGTDIVIQRTPYARYDDLHNVLQPILHKHHFTLMHKNGHTPEGKVMVTTSLRHRDGHSEESIFVGEADPSGSKNNVQGRGSTISYGKRYNTVSLLDILPQGEDDDGNMNRNAPVNAEQLNALLEALEFKGMDSTHLIKVAKIDKLADLPSRRFGEAMNWIKQAKPVGKI